MTKIIFTAASFLFAFNMFFFLNETPSKTAKKLDPVVVDSMEDAEGIVVIELFTSQGCSSCPPADRLLSSLLEEAEKNGQNIFPLSFHVDYWNYLGWRDPFSSKVYSNRQRRYANALSSGVYTPQMVFNGNSECVGSNRTKATSLIKNALDKAPKDKIAIGVKGMEDKTALRVDYEATGSSKNKIINFALVERNINTQVKRGENGGRKLHHDNVVREFKTLEYTGKGSIILNIPDGLDKSKSQVIAYTQDKGSLQVLGASRKGL
ncbi:MAG: DUF1223 domain-containing protein [Bacteroidia bacterium]|nr:DUF1223 domain-containing protein [Bacteroidia bacterium]